MERDARPPPGTSPPPPGADPSLVKRFLGGDAAAFEAIVLRYQAPVRSLLYRLAGNADDAEELAQETFVRVHGHLDGFRRDSSLRTWILRIAANLARDLLRRRRRAPPSVPRGPDLAERISRGARDAPARRMAERERSRAVAAALEELPFTQRTALVLKVIEELSYDEIAEVLCTTPGSVRSSVHLARKRLAALAGPWL